MEFQNLKTSWFISGEVDVQMLSVLQSTFPALPIAADVVEGSSQLSDNFKGINNLKHHLWFSHFSHLFFLSLSSFFWRLLKWIFGRNTAESNTENWCWWKISVIVKCTWTPAWPVRLYTLPDDCIKSSKNLKVFWPFLFAHLCCRFHYFTLMKQTFFFSHQLTVNTS